MRKNLFCIFISILFFAGSFSIALSQQNIQGKIVGIWQARIQSAMGNCLWKMILNQNGKFTKTSQCGNAMVFEWGRYEVGQGYIRLTYEGHEPKQYRGKQFQPSNTEMIFFKFIDENHLYCENRILGGQWDAYRVQ